MSWFPLKMAYYTLRSYYVNCLKELKNEENEKQEKGETLSLTVVEQKEKQQFEE